MTKKPPYRNNLQRNNPNTTHTTVAATYQGPLPPAAQLEQYEKILPGAAERIIATYEKQVDHRHKLEDRYSKVACRDSTTGLWAGFIITLVALLISGTLIYFDKTTGGTILGTTSIGTLAGVFVYGSKVKRQ